MPRITQGHEVPGAGRIAVRNGGDIIRPVPFPNRGSFTPGWEHPIQLFSSVTVVSNAEGSVRGLALANTLEKTIAIREIRFMLTLIPGVDLADGEAITQVSLGGMTAAHLNVGQVAITNGPVPIWLLAPIYSRFDEDAFSSGDNESTSVYVWKLARPFHLPPGAQMSARFRHNGLLRQAVTANIVLAGNVVNRKPATTSAPFASAFVGTPIDLATAFEEDVSETALANVTGVPLNVERMIGRIAAHNPQAAAAPTPDALVFSDANHPEVSRLYSLRMVSSGGPPMIRDFSDFRSIFPYSTASWECPHTMKPGDHYRAVIRKAAGALENYPWQRGQPFISIVGSREVPL